MDACYASARAGAGSRWRSPTGGRHDCPHRARATRLDGRTVIKQERMPDGRLKLILKDEQTGEFADVVRDS